MKYLVLLVVIVVAYLLWRNARVERRSQEGKRAPPRPGGPQEMVSCPVCGLHLPKAEAVSGTNGLLYCSHDHRLRAGG
jgi:uncharacterized protein